MNINVILNLYYTIFYYWSNNLSYYFWKNNYNIMILETKVIKNTFVNSVFLNIKWVNFFSQLFYYFSSWPW